MARSLYWNWAPRWVGPWYRHARSVSWSTQRVSEPRRTRASLYCFQLRMR